MKPIDIILILVVVVILVIAIRRFVGTATGTRDCCSGAKKSLGKQFRARTIDDKDESRYPYQADLEIGGMSCEHCVESVTRALDSVDGTWATVSLAGGHAHVRSKSPIDENAYRKVIEKAGYRLVGIEWDIGTAPLSHEQMVLPIMMFRISTSVGCMPTRPT